MFEFSFKVIPCQVHNETLADHCAARIGKRGMT
jgi:hypothetical protein